MAINTNLLIASPTLQDLIVDKDTGEPLAGGVVTFYEDTQRTILKNWYIQQGNAPPYTYVPGPNPMTLTAVGTFSDAMGNDIIPYFYPYDETNSNAQQLYYVTVYDSGGVLQFTREGFPFVPSSGQPSATVPTLDNYIINNVFWRNLSSLTLPTSTSGVPTVDINGTTYYYNTLAPSNHDGFSMPDFVVLKDILGATESITFQQFAAGQPSNSVLVNDVTPEYYLEWDCTAFQSGQTLKCLQFPLQLHIVSLEDQQAVIVFHARNNGVTSSNTIVVQILQYTGTPTSGSSNSNFVAVQTFTVGDSWQKFVTNPFRLPDAGGINVSSAHDDALYVQFVFPPTTNFDIFFAKPQLYLSNTFATNEYQTYDQVDTIANSSRTGDIRISLNSFSSTSLFGWVIMNDGTIGDASSGSTTRANADTWPLFNLIWNSVGATYAPIFDSAGSPSTYGASAIADWQANKRLSLTKQLGRLIASVGTPNSGTNTGTSWALGQITGNELVTVAANNLPAHMHAAPVGSGGQFIATGTGSGVNIGTGATTTFFGGATGNNSTTNDPVNVQNPVAYFNIYMKL